MQEDPEQDMRTRLTPIARSCLLALAAMPGLAGAGQALPSAEAGASAAPARTTYRVVNLAAGDVIEASINASGQVAYSITPDVREAPPNAYFYDGSSSRNIGTLGNPGSFARAIGITDAGQVVGTSSNLRGETRTYIWSPRRGLVDIGTLPGTSEAIEPVVNRHGVIAGMSIATGSVNRAYRWSAATGMVDLGVLARGEGESAYARAINDGGAVAGDSWAFGNAYHSFLWTFGRAMVSIHTNGSDDSTPVGISARGHVAGNYHAGGGSWRGYIWTPARGMLDLAPPAIPTWLTGMSGSGQVIGYAGDPLAGTDAISWTRGGGLRYLGALGGSFSTVSGLNNNGQVIGAAETGAGAFHAFVWNARDGMVDLNTRLRHAPPGLELQSALAISDNGAIVALANTGLVLLKPVSRPCGCPHTVGPIATGGMVAVGAALDASVSVAGEQPGARYSVTWHWGDGNTARSASTSAGTASRAASRHSYAQPGIYTVTAKVVDRNGTSVDVSRRIVAYAPRKGSAAGTGTFASPLAAAKGAQRNAGLARFSFIAPPAPGAQSALHFEVAGLRFLSRDIRPAAQGARGQFEGSGMLNGKGGYRFALGATASDSARGEPGRVRLKIWQVDPATGKKTVAYDNGAAPATAARGSASLRDGLQGGTGTAAGIPLAEGSIALY